MAPGDDERYDVDDELRLLRWRTERLRALGYEFPRTVLLACSAVDIHELERLIARGCPLGTAVRIAA
jgi:hypothetical protein